MSDLTATYGGKRVFVTGDLGFKGRWLTKALAARGAEVFGFDVKHSPEEDVCAPWQLKGALDAARPDFVFHLAAQAFVPRGFREPRETFETNTLGTVNLLEALRLAAKPCAVVIATTDKVYGESPWAQGLQGAPPFRETDPLAPRCPYSASKVAAEHAVAAYREAYFVPKGNKIAVATARAGNVIGGGDWGEGRLVPNAIRALREGKPVPVYNLDAVRPWQYVEDVIDGYLLLGAALQYEIGIGRGPSPFCSAFNFGPAGHHKVREVVMEVIGAWGAGKWTPVPRELREVHELRIDSGKARRMLGWMPRWGFREMIKEAVAWYKTASVEIAL